MKQETAPPTARPGTYSDEEIAEMKVLQAYLRSAFKVAQKYTRSDQVCNGEYNRQAGLIAVTAAAGLAAVTKTLKDIEREQARRPVVSATPSARFP